METCSHWSAACYLETSTWGQGDIEVLLNPLSPATTCELGLPAAVLWYYCKSNVPLKWQLTTLLMKYIANRLLWGWWGKLTITYFPYCHICWSAAERIGNSFPVKLFKWNTWTQGHLARTWGWWVQSFREMTSGCSFTGGLTEYPPNLHNFPLFSNFYRASYIILLISYIVHLMPRPPLLSLHWFQ